VSGFTKSTLRLPYHRHQVPTTEETRHPA